MIVFNQMLDSRQTLVLIILIILALLTLLLAGVLIPPGELPPIHIPAV